MMKRVIRMAAGTIAISLVVGLGACESSTGPEGVATVSIAFRAASVGGPAEQAAPGANLATGPSSVALELLGSNGTLSLDEIAFIVAEFELEQVESACPGPQDAAGLVRSSAGEDDEDDDAGEGDDDDEDGDDDEDDGCEELEAPPSFVQLALDGAAELAVTRTVAPGVYREVEFEIEDLEVDDGDDRGSVADLFDEIRALFPDWPEEASMLVSGTFTPTDGSPTPFRVFFEAEIEIEREFDPPLDLTAGEEAALTIVVDPAAFFLLPDGTVLDLSQFHGQVVEFEAEMEDGFTNVELDDHDD